MAKNSIKLAILKNEDPFDHLKWIDACKANKLVNEYNVIDLTKESWLEKIIDYKPNILLLKPSGKTSIYRNLYQERLDILVYSLNYKTFPNIEEVKIYENKKFFAYWLKANNLPHPKTFIFYDKDEALHSASHLKLPIVGKINIGASGNGIQVLRTRRQVRHYINKAFGDGLSSKTGPKLSDGKLIQRAFQKFANPRELINRLKTYRAIAKDSQKGFLLFQEFIKHEYEWRAVRIGDSYFAHKKIVSGDKASGTLIKEYGNPPLELLDFTRVLTDRFGFKSVAVDVFEPTKGNYLVNEIQCIFGQSDPYQMAIEGNPGRYIFKNKKWIFEKGNFNSNASYDLRLKTALLMHGKENL